MDAGTFDDRAFFEALDASGARVLVIGRFALVAWGAPLLTADYDVWCPPEDVTTLNGVAATFELYPTAEPDEARRRGRYVLEGDEHVDVMVARSKTTIDGRLVAFDDVWARHVRVPFHGTALHVPALPDLLATKAWADRPKDREDRAWLESLIRRGHGGAT